MAKWRQGIFEMPDVTEMDNYELFILRAGSALAPNSINPGLKLSKCDGNKRRANANIFGTDGDIVEFTLAVRLLADNTPIAGSKIMGKFDWVSPSTFEFRLEENFRAMVDIVSLGWPTEEQLKSAKTGTQANEVNDVERSTSSPHSPQQASRPPIGQCTSDDIMSAAQHKDVGKSTPRGDEVEGLFEELFCSLSDTKEALAALAKTVERHQTCIAEIGDRVQKATDWLECVAEEPMAAAVERRLRDELESQDDAAHNELRQELSERLDNTCKALESSLEHRLATVEAQLTAKKNDPITARVDTLAADLERLQAVHGAMKALGEKIDSVGKTVARHSVAIGFFERDHVQRAARLDDDDIDTLRELLANEQQEMMAALFCKLGRDMHNEALERFFMVKGQLASTNEQNFDALKKEMLREQATKFAAAKEKMTRAQTEFFNVTKKELLKTQKKLGGNGVSSLAPAESSAALDRIKAELIALLREEMEAKERSLLTAQAASVKALKKDLFMSVFAS